MENKISYILVGVFVLVITVCIVAVIVWFSNYNEDTVFKYYKVNTKESVAGLNLKAPVKLRGVAIGEVKDININPDNAEEVTVVIKIKEDTPIKEDTHAIVEAQGITGLSYIELRGGTNEAKNLQTGGKYSEYGIIHSKPSVFSRLDKTITSVSRKAEEIFERADDILSEKNLKNIEDILANTANISNAINQTLAGVEEQKKLASKLLEQALVFEEAAINAAKGVSDMSKSFTNAIDNTGIDTMNSMRDASKSVKQTMAGLNEKLEKGTFDIDVMVKENLLPAQGAIEDLRGLINETKDIVTNLRDSPSDLIFKEETINPAPNERR
ncbi:MAG: MlaD family protein [Sulfurospirillaceae bacterium]|nr:MlaD family protein [Sulfurospirillaceae bacterium]MDD3462043.1 MlaD family protein [Sulfurospirillaceae bacterium]